MNKRLCENCGHIQSKHRIVRSLDDEPYYEWGCSFIFENGDRCKCTAFKTMEIVKQQTKRGNYGSKQQLVGTIMRFTKNPEERQAWLDFMAEDYDNEKQTQKTAMNTYYKNHPREQQHQQELSRIRQNTAHWRKRVAEKPSIAFDILEKLITAQ